MAKGRKICPECRIEVGARVLTCPNSKCQHIFKLKKLKTKKEQISWTKLTPGSIISVEGGGPYYESGDGVKHGMGYSGKFLVQSLDDNGIVATGNGGYAYIFMGDDKKMESGTMMVAHKIRTIGV